MSTILKQLQSLADGQKGVDDIVKFAKSGELAKLHKTQKESVEGQISKEEMKGVLSDVTFIK